MLIDIVCYGAVLDEHRLPTVGTEQSIIDRICKPHIAYQRITHHGDIDERISVIRRRVTEINVAGHMDARRNAVKMAIIQFGITHA